MRNWKPGDFGMDQCEVLPSLRIDARAARADRRAARLSGLFPRDFALGRFDQRHLSLQFCPRNLVDDWIDARFAENFSFGCVPPGCGTNDRTLVRVPRSRLIIESFQSFKERLSGHVRRTLEILSDRRFDLLDVGFKSGVDRNVVLAVRLPFVSAQHQVVTLPPLVAAVRPVSLDARAIEIGESEAWPSVASQRRVVVVVDRGGAGWDLSGRQGNPVTAAHSSGEASCHTQNDAPSAFAR